MVTCPPLSLLSFLPFFSPSQSFLSKPTWWTGKFTLACCRLRWVISNNRDPSGGLQDLVTPCPWSLCSLLILFYFIFLVSSSSCRTPLGPWTLTDPQRPPVKPADIGMAVPCPNLDSALTTHGQPWAVRGNAWNMVITERTQMLKKETAGQGGTTWVMAGRLQGTHESTRRWVRQKDELSRPRWHLGAITSY